MGVSSGQDLLRLLSGLLTSSLALNHCSLSWTPGGGQCGVGTKHQACAIEIVKQSKVDHVHGTPADHGYVETIHPDQWTLERAGIIGTSML